MSLWASSYTFLPLSVKVNFSTRPVSAGMHKPNKSSFEIASFGWCSYFQNLLTIKEYYVYFWGVILWVNIYIISRVSGLFKSHS